MNKISMTQLLQLSFAEHKKPQPEISISWPMKFSFMYGGKNHLKTAGICHQNSH